MNHSLNDTVHHGFLAGTKQKTDLSEIAFSSARLWSNLRCFFSTAASLDLSPSNATVTSSS